MITECAVLLQLDPPLPYFLAFSAFVFFSFANEIALFMWKMEIYCWKSYFLFRRIWYYVVYLFEWSCSFSRTWKAGGTHPTGMLSCSCLSHTSTRMFVFHEAIIRLVYLNTNTTPEKLQVLVTGSRQNISKYCVFYEINVVFAQNSWLCSLRTGNSDG